jgi:hypothetical protein
MMPVGMSRSWRHCRSGNCLFVHAGIRPRLNIRQSFLASEQAFGVVVCTAFGDPGAGHQTEPDRSGHRGGAWGSLTCAVLEQGGVAFLSA